VKVAALMVGLLIMAGLAWSGGELHYRGCVDAAQARHPVQALAGSDNPFGREDSVLGPSEDSLLDSPGGDRRREIRTRRAAVDGCSRLPW